MFKPQTLIGEFRVEGRVFLRGPENAADPAMSLRRLPLPIHALAPRTIPRPRPPSCQRLSTKHTLAIAVLPKTMSNAPPAAPVLPSFPVSPPDPDLAQRPPARRAACVIIGDEILNGKTLDTNSRHLAGLLFRSGISLNKIEVVPDVEDEIVECVRRLSQPEARFDMIFTSGGIGPTHGMYLASHKWVN